MNNYAKELYYFASSYLSKLGKPIESITEYYHYDMELIAKNRKHILRFFENHFNFHLGSMRADEMLCDKEGKRWSELENILELETFEIVIGLAIAVGLFKDSLADRLNSLANMEHYTTYLQKELFSLYDEDVLKEYLVSLRDYCVHYYEFNIDSDVYEYMKLITNGVKPIEESHEAIKDIIVEWLKSSSMTVTDNDIRIINRLMRNNFDKFINCVVTAFDAEDGAEALLITLRTDPEFEAMNQIDKLIKKYTDNELTDLEKRKKIFLDKIRLTSEIRRKLQ